MKPRAFRNTLLRLAISLLALALVLATLEVALRLLWRFQELDIRMSRPSPHPAKTVCEYNAYLGWKNRPNTEVELSYYHGRGRKKVLEKTNSQGVRGREYSTSKPRGVFRVICLGCSRTYGFGVNQGETYPHYLEELLNQKLKRRAEVLNFGVNGYGLDQMALLFEKYARHFEPDLVILQMYGPSVNRLQYDVNYHTRKPAFSLVNGVLRLKNVPVPRKRFQNIENWLMRRSFLFVSIKKRMMKIEQSRREVRQARLRAQGLDLLASKILERLKQQTDAVGVPLVVFVWGSDRKLMPIAADAGINVIHLDDYEKESPWAETAALDNPRPTGHWSAHGTRYVATALCNYVLKSGIAESVEDAQASPEYADQ